MRVRGLGCLSVLLGLVLLALLWVLRGKRLFTPGPLSSRRLRGEVLGGVRSHAELEDRCEACHTPWQAQGALCLRCHTRIQKEINEGRLHARFAAPLKCRACHPDHRGRQADLLRPALEGFDHEITAFSLRKHTLRYDLTPLLCRDCHTQWPVEGLAPVAQQCRTCHEQADPAFMQQHIRGFHARCLECHDGVDRMVQFDHAATRFPLEGAHQKVRCEGCHQGGRFQGTSTACRACHKEPEVHRGLFSNTCADCHTPTGWAPARWEGRLFNHAADTGFSLARHKQDPDTGQAITCIACHGQDIRTFQIQQCVRCHRQRNAGFMQRHLATYGPQCLQCHDGVDRMRGFDHAQVFPLDGAHAQVKCRACHAQFRFRGTPRTCQGCHAEPALHRGVFGMKCHYCHVTRAWAPARLRLHVFPVDHGGNPAAACAVCHPGNRYARYTCYGCHDHTPAGIRQSHLAAGISEAELPRCAACHPNGQ